MKKVTGFIVSLIVLIAIILDGFWLFFKNKNAQTETSTTSGTQQTASADSTGATSSTSSSSSSSSSNSASSSSSSLKDGSYTGAATSTEWGDVQVQAVVSGGKLTKVNVLEYPNDNGHDQKVNSQALPVYKKEAISAQGADIQLVSGASETYKGFTGSLQDALNQAKEGSSDATTTN
jgi:uncharacterized protein with FMN-binding domain